MNVVRLCIVCSNFLIGFVLQARPLLAQALEDEDFEGLVDPRLEKNYVGSEMFRMIEAAAACVRHSATKRPRMSQVCMFALEPCFVIWSFILFSGKTELVLFFSLTGG